MTQASGPPSGMQLRPETTLPLATDRAGSLVSRVRAVVEDLRLPRRLARRRVDRVDVVVGAVVDDQVAVDGDVAVGRDREEVVVEVVREVATVLPQ